MIHKVVAILTELLSSLTKACRSVGIMRMSVLRQVTDTTGTVLPIDLNIADDTSRLLHGHITQLLKQRSNALTVHIFNDSVVILLKHP